MYSVVLTMITALALKISHYLVEQGAAEKEDVEIYQYGIGLFLSTVFNIAAVLAMSLFTGMFAGTVLFLLIFITLRTVTGGYHANTYMKCFIVFICVYTACTVTVFMTPEKYYHADCNFTYGGIDDYDSRVCTDRTRQ
jgi:accessory gene regulator B